MKRLTIAILLFLLITPLKAINVVFRCDDLTLSYDSVSNRILDLFIQKQVPLSVAMIPCDSNEEPYQMTDSLYWQKLNNSGIEVCLHGLTHQYTKDHGEFGLLSPEETQRRIHKGKSVLQIFFSKPIQTFIPPFSAINDSLSRILHDEGFQILSFDRYGKINLNDILCYPETLGFLMQRFGIWEAGRISIFNNVTSSDLCVIMFHDYDLPDEESWNVLENLLDDCTHNQDIHLYTFSGLKDAGIDGSKTRYNANKLEGFLQKYCMPKGMFCSTFHCYTIHILNALLYLLLVIIITFISQRIAQTLLGKRVCLIVGLIGAIIVCSFALFHLIGPLKLWGLDFVMCIVTLAIAIADYVRHK